MTLSAEISIDGQKFKAVLSDGRVFLADDVDALAAMLVTVGVPIEYAHCGDWRNGDTVLMSGQAIALKWEMRRLLSSIRSDSNGERSS